MRSTLVLAIAALPFINALTISKTGQCGAATQLTCKGSTFGSCCSQHNYCGSTLAYCGTGCQLAYGTCGTTTPPVIPAKVSTDGSCGGTKGFTCLNSPFGNCCSQFGYCGKTSAYCGSGCNSKFGTCTGSPAPSSTRVSSSMRPSSTLTRASSTSIRTSSTSVRVSSTSTRSSVAVPSSTLKVSTNARCGKGGFEAFTCAASKYGDCCSQHSYCGSTDDYCSPQNNCQAGYGRCGPKPSSSSVGSSSSSSRASSSSTSQSSLASSTVVSTMSSSALACPSGLVPSITFAPRQIGADVTSCVPSAISTATLSSSSSSSEIPSTTVAASSSTTVAALPSTSSCVLSPTNLVKNPSFETGDIEPWVSTGASGWYILGLQENPSFRAAHAGTWQYFGSSYNSEAQEVSIIQTDIPIPSGTVVDCSMWVYSARLTDGKTTFSIMLDDQICGSVLNVTEYDSSEYAKIGGQVTVLGDTHRVTLKVSYSRSDGEGTRFGIDDVAVISVACPVSSSVTVLSSSSSSSVDTTTPTPTETLTLTSTSTSATTISSSPIACVPTSTNVIINPSFDTGLLVPWAQDISGTWDTAGIVGGESHTGPYYYSATNINGFSGSILLAQSFSVPDDTTVDAYMWVTAQTLKYSTLFVIYLDGVGVPGGSITIQSAEWQKIGGQVRLTRGTHDLAIMIYTASSLGDNMVGIDDIYVGAVPAEGCPSTTTTAPAPPGETV